MAAPVVKAASLAHIARESSDIHRLSQFYKEMFGFEEIESPNFGELKVIWLIFLLPFNFTSSRETLNPSFPKVHGAPRHPLRTLAIFPEVTTSVSLFPVPISTPSFMLSRKRASRLLRKPYQMGR